MDGQAFRTAVEEAKATQLDRLGSNKLLIALTDATLERERVLQAAADSENAARETFRQWREDESDADARAAFADVADQEAEHRRRVLSTMEADYDPNDGGPLHTYLRGREGTVERIAAGMVARPLVSLRTHQQVINFFVNEAEPSTAELFRELRAETGAVIDRALPMLERRCDQEQWDAARMVAEYTITVAYDDYADALAGMGLDPAPVC